MDISLVLKDKSTKPSEKPGIIAAMLLESPALIEELLEVAANSKDADKGSCIEALEHVTLKMPEIATEKAFRFVTGTLTSNAPRVKWESARVIGNTAKRFPELLNPAVTNLLANTEHPGTVVRWSAAFALGEIIKLKSPLNESLIPAALAIIEREEKNSIRKIYEAAIKKAGR